MNNRIISKIDRIREILELDYRLDINTVEKITNTTLKPGQLPQWHLYIKSALEISRMIYVTTQALNARTDHLTVTSEDGKEISYFINVGQDYPGKLRRFLRENSNLEIVSYDSDKLYSGQRILTIEKRGRTPFPMDSETQAGFQELLAKIRLRGEERSYQYTGQFISSFPLVLKGLIRDLQINN